LPRQRAIHYGWVIVVAGFLTVFAGLGLARFGLGMLLPSMGVGLGLSYSQMGLISTGNFIGYLAAVLAAGALVRGIGTRWTITGGLVVVACSMLIVSRADGFAEVLVFYCLTGVASGIANVPAMALVSHWFARAHRGKAAGYVASGSGLGIILTGATLPALSTTGPESWRVGWLVLGAIALVVAVTCGLLLRNRPEDLGLAPFGHHPVKEAESGLPTRYSTALALAHIGSIYSLFGATYVVYLTFIVTSLVKDRGFTEVAAGQLWATLGFLSLFSGPIFGTLSDRMGRRAGLMIVFAAQCLAYLLAAAPLVPAFLYVSVCLFGLVAWSIPSIMAALVGDYFGPEKAASAFGAITLFFGFGQIVGPAVAGWAAEMTGGFSVSFAMAAALALVAIGLAAPLPPPAKRGSH
jgi:MFS family permease